MVRLAAVTTCLNEADIIGATLAHLYEQGVGNVYVYDGMSTDGTRDVLSQFPCKVFDDDSPVHRQPALMSELAHRAYEDGADFILPVDSDEFWCATTGGTLADVFATVDDEVGKLYAPMFHHYTWDERELTAKPWPKVAFRAYPNVVIKNGNHEVDVPGRSLNGLLEIRELQYRGEDHFVRKVRERCNTLDPSLPDHEGTHHTRFRAMTDDEIRVWWRADNPFWGDRRNIVVDPIPSKFRVGQCTTAS